MFHRSLILGCFLLAILAMPRPTRAVPPVNLLRMVAGTVQTGAAYRRCIRHTPILERPHRFGHFYGNTVRRRHHRRG